MCDNPKVCYRFVVVVVVRAPNQSIGTQALQVYCLRFIVVVVAFELVQFFFSTRSYNNSAHCFKPFVCERKSERATILLHAYLRNRKYVEFDVEIMPSSSLRVYKSQR